MDWNLQSFLQAVLAAAVAIMLGAWTRMHGRITRVEDRLNVEMKEMREQNQTQHQENIAGREKMVEQIGTRMDAMNNRMNDLVTKSDLRDMVNMLRPNVRRGQ